MLDREISQRMDAYRGNPQALMQRYQQSQQLIDLLALQKLKSEKEAAVRSLQMQQTPEGGLPTVAQQREKEVMDMTRQEVAQQVGQTAQQQQQKQQAAMQQLMSGVARAPGAGNAMSPQAMAAGGIVAFQSGGSSRLAEEERKRKEEEELEQARLAAAARDMRGYGLAAVLPPSEESEAEPARRPIVDNPQAIAARVLNPESTPSTQAAPVSGVGGLNNARTLAEKMTGVSRSQLNAAERQREGLEALQGAISSAQMKASEFPGMRPEDLTARQAEIATARERMQKEFDPESERLNQLIATLSAMGGRTSIGSMGAAGAQAGMTREAQREAARRERLKEISGMEENLRQRQEAERMGKFQAEVAAGNQAVQAKLKAADLAKDIFEGDARRANELLSTGLRIAGEAGITDTKLNAEIDMLAKRLGVQMSIDDRKNFVDLLKIGAQERATAAQLEKTTDLKDAAAAYAADFKRRNPNASDAEARAYGFRTAQELGIAARVDPTSQEEVQRLRLISQDSEAKMIGIQLGVPANAQGPNRDKLIQQLRGVYARYGARYPGDADATARATADARASAGGAGETGGAGGAGAPNTAHINYLRNNDTPENRRMFDEKFGAGAAAKVIGR